VIPICDPYFRRRTKKGRLNREKKSMAKRTMFATAAAVFAVGTFATAASAQVPCTGVNACKGQSACKSANNACKGQNACKGKGFVNAGSTIECTVLKTK
jgi:hypothetical protein